MGLSDVSLTTKIFIILVMALYVLLDEICALIEQRKNRRDYQGRNNLMSITYSVTEYNRDDMLALDNMSKKEVLEAIDYLDRGYFNRYLYPEYDNESETYSEEEYNDYRIRVALRKVYEYLEDTKDREEE